MIIFREKVCELGVSFVRNRPPPQNKKEKKKKRRVLGLSLKQQKKGYRVFLMWSIFIATASKLGLLKE